jgi:hemerythrin
MMLERKTMLIHDKAVKKLAPADYIIIEEEHEQLKKFLDDLHDTCYHLDTLVKQGNESEKTATYRGRLPSFLFYVTELATKHFKHEEAIMLSRPNVTEEYVYFRAHKQAHEEILENLDILVDKCFSLDTQVNIAEIYHQFHKKLSDLFEEHDRAFDDPFIQSTKT